MTCANHHAFALLRRDKGLIALAESQKVYLASGEALPVRKAPRLGRGTTVKGGRGPVGLPPHRGSGQRDCLCCV